MADHAAIIDRIADHMHRNSRQIADAIVEASRREIPEYADMTVAARDLQRDRQAFWIEVLGEMIRERRTAFTDEEMDLLRATTAQVALEEEPLHAVVGTFQISAREVIRSGLIELEGHGPEDAVALSAAIRSGLGLMETYIATLAHHFVEFREQRRVFNDPPSRDLVADLLAGISLETIDLDELWGVQEMQGLRVLVSIDVAVHPVPFILDAERERGTPARFSMLGDVAVAVVCCDRHDASTPDRVAHVLWSGITGPDRPSTVVVGPWQPDLAGAQLSFDDALTAASAAGRLGWSHVVSGDRALIATLIGNADDARFDLTKILGPLRALRLSERSEAIAFLVAFVASGCSVKGTAERLHMHRNTARRRLAEIEERLGVVVADHPTEVELALSAWREADAH